MALPSSQVNPNQVQGIQGPGFVNLAAYTADPSRWDSAFQTGFNTANAVSDNLLLRPKQVAAAGAQADYLKAKSNSDTGMVPAEAAARTQLLTAQNAGNADSTQAAKDSLEERTNPGREGRLLTAQATATADDAEKATAAVTAAHAAIEAAKGGVSAGGPPEDLVKAQKQLESAINASGRAAAAADVANKNLMVYTANTTSKIKNAQDAATTATVKEGINTSTAKQQVSTGLANAAVTEMNASDVAQAAAQFSARDAKIQSLALAPQITAKMDEANAARWGVAPDPDLRTAQTPVSIANNNAAGAVALTTDLAAQAELQRLATQIGSGEYTGAVDPKLEESIRVKAAELGVPSIIPGTQSKRPLAQVAADYSKAVNVKEAAPQLAQIRAEATAGSSALGALTRIKGLGKVDTGALYILPGVQKIDRVLSQFGVEGSQKREAMEAFNTQLVPLVRQPGQVSNYEQRTYKTALPGPGVSEKTNVDLLTGLYFVAERTAAKPAFFDALTGPLPVNEVNKLWDQYMESNPSVNEDGTFNKSAVTAPQYLKLISSAPGVADREVKSLAAKQDVNTLPAGNTAADFAAAPLTAPFLAARNARGTPTPVVNPKYWAPILNAANSLRSTVTPPKPQARVDPSALLYSDPATLIRPVPTTDAGSVPLGPRSP